MRVLITGASGFAGRHLTSALRMRGHDLILAVSPRASEADQSGAAAIDLTDADAVDELVARAKLDAIAHLAAVSSHARAWADPRATWRVHLGATMNLATSVMAHAPAAFFLFVSSAEVYGGTFATGQALNENARLDPLNPYSSSKIAAEYLLRQMAHGGLRVAIARPFNHAGPGQSAEFALPNFARQIALIEAGERKPSIETGPLEDRRNIVDVRDIAEAYARIIERADQLENGVTINLASDELLPMRAFLDRMLAQTSTKISVRTKSYPTASHGGIRTKAGDASAARDLLGWAPQISVDQMLGDILNDWRQRVR